jgi:prophage regulatory protein
MLSQGIQDSAAIQAARLIRLKEVKQLTCLSSSSIYRLVSAGKFPQPVKLSQRASAWIETEVRLWIADRIGERRSAVPETEAPTSEAEARGTG